MQKYNKLTCIVLFIFSFMLTHITCAQPKPTLKNALQQETAQARVKNNVTALQMSIILPNGKQLNFASGTTKIKNGKPVNKNTLFQIGSNTKSFTSAVMLTLLEHGKLLLKDKLKQWLPEFKKWRNVNIKELLNNTSGIYNYSEDKHFQYLIDKEPQKVWSNQELLDFALEQKSYFKPGKGWHYSNTNYLLAAMIAEQITNQTIGDLYTNYFFDNNQLKLSNTFYLPQAYPIAIAERMAHGYDEQGKDITDVNMSWAGPAGAMVATANNLAKWGYALFHDQVLTKQTMQLMMTPVSTKNGRNINPNTQEGYALGIGVKQSVYGPWWGHQGETLGYHSVFAWFPKYNITIAVNANGPAKDLVASMLKMVGIVVDNPKKSIKK